MGINSKKHILLIKYHIAAMKVRPNVSECYCAEAEAGVACMCITGLWALLHITSNLLFLK